MVPYEDLCSKSDKVYLSALNETLYRLVAEDIEVISNQVHNLITPARRKIAISKRWHKQDKTFVTVHGITKEGNLLLYMA